MLFIPTTNANSSLFDSLIYEAHPPFSIVHVNKAFMECTGKSNEHLVGKPVEDVIASDVTNTIVSPILPKSQQMRGKIGDTVFQYSIKAIKSHISSYFLIEMADNNLGTLGKRAINQINHSDILVGCIG
jgi:transcriptional regulator with PAS, ATPase and Fis domain